MHFWSLVGLFSTTLELNLPFKVRGKSLSKQQDLDNMTSLPTSLSCLFFLLSDFSPKGTTQQPTMVIFLDLEETDIYDPRACIQGGASAFPPPTCPSKNSLPSETDRPNPNLNAISAALNCYPYASPPPNFSFCFFFRSALQSPLPHPRALHLLNRNLPRE